MSRFYGYRRCTVCGESCTPGNFVDFKGKRFCTACWIERENPKHKQIDDIRSSGREAASKWKRQKYSRNEGPLPTGPMSARKD